MQGIDSKILNRIYGRGKGCVVTPGDFLDLGSRGFCPGFQTGLRYNRNLAFAGSGNRTGIPERARDPVDLHQQGIQPLSYRNLHQPDNDQGRAVPAQPFQRVPHRHGDNDECSVAGLLDGRLGGDGRQLRPAPGTKRLLEIATGPAVRTKRLVLIRPLC